MSFDVSAIRRHFPFLSGKNPIAYLDSAATSQKPDAVLEAMRQFQTASNANVNRGVYPLAEAATQAYDAARRGIASFIGAKPHEIVFTKNATEAINLVARTWSKGDVMITTMEHHSNIVPWQQRTTAVQSRVRWIDVDENGMPEMKAMQRELESGGVSLVAVTGLSNVLGSMPELRKIADLTHKNGAHVLVDASQLIAHRSVDVRELDCDFLAFSGHKLYGPSGIGVLFGKAELLDALPPFLGGGDMIHSVTKEGFVPAELPRKFEAGSPPAAEAVGLAAAIGWMQSVGIDAIHRHADNLISSALDSLSSLKGVRILGPADASHRAGCVSFVLEGIHPHDLTDVLGKEGVCLRAGHHCAQPLHDALGINASARLSVAAYNTEEEIARCIAAIGKARTLLAK